MSDMHDYRDDDRLLLGPAAALVGVHPDTLRRWADAGRVPVTRSPGNQRRFRVGDLRALDRPDGEAEPRTRAQPADLARSA